MTRTTAALTALVLLVTLLPPGTADAFPHARRGTILGLNLGTGGSALEYDSPLGHVKNEVDEGVTVGARLGYAFSRFFALSLEVHGYGWDDGGRDRSSGVGLLVATWFPGGGGFFLRAGVGGGRVDVKEGALDWTDRSCTAAGLGLGYEWRVGPRFALGLAADGYVVSLDDLPAYRETTVGHGSLSLQLNWYLR